MAMVLIGVVFDCNIFCLYLALAQKKQCLVFSEKKDYKRNMMFRRIN